MNGDSLQDQLASLYTISVEIAGLHRLAEIHDRVLGYCLDLTAVEFAFMGLIRTNSSPEFCGFSPDTDEQVMDVAAIKGFTPSPSSTRHSDSWLCGQAWSAWSSRRTVPISVTTSKRIRTVSANLRATHRSVRFLGVPLRLETPVSG